MPENQKRIDRAVKIRMELQAAALHTAAIKLHRELRRPEPVLGLCDALCRTIQSEVNKIRVAL